MVVVPAKGSGVVSLSVTVMVVCPPQGLERLRTGDKAHCRFRFVRFPEYITKGARIVFREGRTKAVGTILYCGVINFDPLSSSTE